MQGTKLLLGLTLFILAGCNELPERIENKNASAISDSEFTTGETETRSNTNIFLAQIAACSINEMKAGQLAEKRATTHSVKNFASEMVHAERGVNAAVKQLEQQVHINIAAIPSHTKESAPIVFKNKKNTAFDKDFMNAIIVNHKKAIALLVGATAENIDLDIKVFITEVLPQLQVHLVQAETIRNELP